MTIELSENTLAKLAKIEKSENSYFFIYRFDVNEIIKHPPGEIKDELFNDFYNLVQMILEDKQLMGGK